MPEASSLYESVFHSLEEQIAVIDQAGNILEVNRAWQRFGADNGLASGYTCVGHNYIDTLSISSAAGDVAAGEVLDAIAGVMAGRLASFSFEYPCHGPDGERWFTMRIAALHGDARGGLFVISHHDVTQRKLAEQRAEQLAMEDPLTGLANRRAFQLFLNREVRNCMRSRTPIGLALIDVDYFKNYNDEFGHAAGDQCLMNVSQILLTHVRRAGDLAARIGGDEFALILANTDLEALRGIAESVLNAINDLKMEFGNSKQITLSIGLLSAVPHESLDEDRLLQGADRALYRAKSAGRNQVACVQPGANELA